jgi:Cu-Zn family superoxide dismutase
MRLAHTLLFLGLAVGLAACDREGSENTEPVGPTADADIDTDADTVAPDDSGAAGTMLAASAIATLQPAPGGTASGTLNFAIDDGGVRMTGGITGLDPDTAHGMHIHEVGDCSAPDFVSAGDHFNPDAQPHGDRAGSGPHHAGDMPNVVADAAGNAKVDQRLEGLAIDSGGANDIVGKAVIVHAEPDDYSTQPSGASGARIACGVIELENPAPEYLGPADAGEGNAQTATPATPGTGAAVDTDNPTDVPGAPIEGGEVEEEADVDGDGAADGIDPADR